MVCITFGAKLSSIFFFAFINIEVLSVKKIENLFILRNPSNIGIKSVH